MPNNPPRRRSKPRIELPPTAGLPVGVGDFIRRPKRPFAEGLQLWLQLPEPVITCSGTAALAVALQTLRMRNPGRSGVIFPAYTCPLVPLCVRLLPGLRAIPCDTLPGGFDMDPQKLAELCDDGVLAVVPTHLGGRVADVGSVAAIARRSGAAVIEDAAQAMGAFDNGNSVGLEGDVGFFSLAVGKGLTIYEGGVLFSREPDLHDALRSVAAEMLPPNLLWNARRMAELLGYALMYNPSGLRLAYGRRLRRELARNDEAEAVGDRFSLSDIPLHRPDALRLRVAANALERLPAWLDEGRRRAVERIRQLRSLTGASVIEDKPGADGVWPFFMLLFSKPEQRDLALRRLWTAGLGVSKLFVSAAPDYDYLSGEFARAPDCPKARDFASRMLTIGNSPWLDDESFSLILEQMRSRL